MHRVEGQPLSTIFREAIQICQRLELEESRLGRQTPDTRRIHFAEPRNIRSREADIDSLSYRRRSDSWRSSSPRHECASRYEPPRSPRYNQPRSSRHEPPRPPRSEPPRYTTGPIHRGPPADCFCRYCKVPGHDIYECGTREFNNTLRPGEGLNHPCRNGPQREEQPRESKQ